MVNEIMDYGERTRAIDQQMSDQYRSCRCVYGLWDSGLLG